MRYRQGPVRSNPPSPRPPPKRVPMKKLATPIIAALLLAAPAHAIVGGGTPQADGVARAVVTIVGSRGNFCTGSLIAPKLVLTVAHCVQPGADYKIVDRGTDGQPQLLNVRTVAIHPNFNMQAMQRIAPPPTWRCCNWKFHSRENRRCRLACRIFQFRSAAASSSPV